MMKWLSCLGTCTILVGMIIVPRCFADDLALVRLESPSEGLTFSSTADPNYGSHPWRAQMVNPRPVATMWMLNSRMRSANLDVLKVNAHTYEPYSGQSTDFNLSLGSPHGAHFATVKIWLSGPSLHQDPLWGGYSGYCQGGGVVKYVNGYPDYSDLNWCAVGEGDTNSHPDLANYGYSLYLQTAYPGVPLGDAPHSTIPAKGCFLCSMCGAFNSLGISVEPLTMNAWLMSQTDGYIGRNLNVYAALRWVNDVNGQSHVGKRLMHVRNVPLDEANDRGLAVQVSVKNGYHWVTAPCRQVENENSPVQHRMLDPMGRHDGILEGYGGVNTNNTRCYYWKDEWYKPLRLSEVDWGNSAIVASAGDNVDVTLLNSTSNTVVTADDEYIEDDETEEVEWAGRMLEAVGVPSDNYTLRVSGIR